MDGDSEDQSCAISTDAIAKQIKTGRLIGE
jgi:hypothetical protein